MNMKKLKPFITVKEEDESKDAMRLERAKKVDLITMPESIEGTNCANCRFVDLKTQYCKNPEVDQKVSPRMCCALWDAPGTKREWLEE